MIQPSTTGGRRNARAWPDGSSTAPGLPAARISVTNASVASALRCCSVSGASTGRAASHSARVGSCSTPARLRPHASQKTPAPGGSPQNGHTRIAPSCQPAQRMRRRAARRMPDCTVMSPAEHPVAELLRARRLAGSARGARRDPHSVALVIEGGGMRGVVSAGMVAALERLGLSDAFDLVIGSSAGALNGAGLLGGVTADGPGVYAGPLASKEFINPARLLIGRPAVNLQFLLGYAAANFGHDAGPGAIERLAPLICVAVDVESAAPVSFSHFTTQQQLWQAMMAT